MVSLAAQICATIFTILGALIIITTCFVLADEYYSKLLNDSLIPGIVALVIFAGTITGTVYLVTWFWNGWH